MSSYDKRPILQITDADAICYVGWAEIAFVLGKAIAAAGRQCRVAFELYPGTQESVVAAALLQHWPDLQLLLTRDAFNTPAALQEIFRDILTDDPVFNVMRPAAIESYFEPHALERLRASAAQAEGLVVVLGAGAFYALGPADLLLSGNISRWELQQRQRLQQISNLGFRDRNASPAELYKVAYFLDWRVADDARHRVYSQIDFFLDLNDEAQPKLLSGETLRAAVRSVVARPFRLVPFFDPGPWGGQWMRRIFNLPQKPFNFAWGFDCVPEENSVLLGFGDRHFELPAIVLVHEEPKALLGDTIVSRFGAEFPIRFDLLDTVEGGNLSLQVHPTSGYIREHFGMTYTQDESYYILHAEPGSEMYLGLVKGTDPGKMAQCLMQAQAQGEPFQADTFIARWPTATHDHFSIPAGTVHCSGAGNVVLEISATPYIFTFKLWDWDRTGLDGVPRPIHLDHGLANINWNRDAAWVERELVNQITPVAAGRGWREERTGLHESQFIETRRHWFKEQFKEDTAGNLRVINLVQGPAVLLSSPQDAFQPLCLHYAETCILPAALGPYVVSPAGEPGEELALVTAFVRGLITPEAP